ncbi:MAG: hypothetical protein AAF585_04365 [Verrucomicrobiota bacterium]
MKTLIPLLAAGAFLVAASTGYSIPDNIGFIGGLIGQELEQAMEEPSTWEAPDLPGEWKAGDDKTVERLQDAARVFGLLAATVDAKKAENRLSALRLTYDAKSAKDLKNKSLYEALLFNIQAFSGGKPEKNGQTTVFKADGLVISAQSSGRDEAVVTITRAS